MIQVGRKESISNRIFYFIVKPIHTKAKIRTIGKRTVHKIVSTFVMTFLTKLGIPRHEEVDSKFINKLEAIDTQTNNNKNLSNHHLNTQVSNNST